MNLRRHKQYLQRMEHKKKALNKRLPAAESPVPAVQLDDSTPLINIFTNPDGTLKIGLSVADLKQHMAEKIKRREESKSALAAATSVDSKQKKDTKAKKHIVKVRVLLFLK